MLLDIFYIIKLKGGAFMNKTKKILNAIAATGSIITYIYCIMNLSATILAFTIPYDAISFLFNPIFIIDGFTWHIYGIFSILTFIIKLTSIGYSEGNSSLKKSTLFHFVAMIVRFATIVFIFFNASI